MTAVRPLTGRLTRAAVAGIAVLLAVSGCVELPQRSGVHAGRDVGVQVQQPPPFNRPSGPRPGASPTAIAQGYLAAMLAYPQSDALVRQFMTPHAAASWDPSRGTVVYENQTLVTKRHDVVLTGEVLGSLDSRGTWHSASKASSPLSLRLRLERVSGQWRIANPPPGTYVPNSFFTLYYEPLSLYFFDPERAVLVPAPVFVLQGRSAPTTLVQDLLRGPTEELKGMVVTAAPSTTSLQRPVRVSSSGVAEVPLSPDVLGLSPLGRRLLASQLVWTLNAPELGIAGVGIRVRGHALAIPGVGDVMGTDAPSAYDPTGLAASRLLFASSRAGRLVSLSGNSVAAVPGAIGRVRAPGGSAAVDLSGSTAAVVTSKRDKVLVGSLETGTASGSPEVWYAGGSDLLRPSWDLFNDLWLVDATSEGAMLIVVHKSPGGHLVRRVVNAPGISGADVRSFAVSRDGVRFAAVLGKGTASELVLAIIHRRPGAPGDVQLTRVHRVTNADYPLVNMTYLAWSSPTQLAVLGQDQGSQTQPYEVSIDGSSVTPLTGFLPVQPVSLGAGPNTDAPIVLGAGKGRVFVRTPDGQWRPLGLDQQIFRPFYPG